MTKDNSNPNDQIKQKNNHEFVSSIVKHKEMIFLFTILASLFVVLIYNQDQKNIEQIKKAVDNITEKEAQRFAILENNTEERALEEKINGIDVINTIFMLLLDNRQDLDRIMQSQNITPGGHVKLNGSHIIATNLLSNNSIVEFKIPFPINLTNIEQLSERDEIKTANFSG